LDLVLQCFNFDSELIDIHMSSIIEGYSYDIFISYRQKDNKHDSWVTEFVDNLKGELESMFKDEVSLYFDVNPSDYLLESYDVDASLKDKLKSLVFVPIISRTYCDPRSFAWDNELKAFVRMATEDRFGFKIKLPHGNVANRVLPIRIHDLDLEDIKLFESVVGGMMRSIDFVYKETGVNRQLTAKDDNILRSPGQVLYRDQINKVALTIKEIIESMKYPNQEEKPKRIEILQDKGEERKEKGVEKPIIIEKRNSEFDILTDKVNLGKEKKSHISIKRQILIPVVLALAAILTGSSFFLIHQSKIKWAKEDALPQIEQLANSNKMDEAFKMSQDVARYLSKNRKFTELVSSFTNNISIITDPDGAEVMIRDFSDTTAQWKNLGRTPIGQLRVPKHSYYLMKIEKPGYESIEGVMQTRIDTVFRRLFKPGTIPPGMVYVYGYQDELSGNYLKEKNGFFIDRFEVTNKEFKKFVDDGGYRKPEYWKYVFIKDGKKLSLDEALSEFKDKTGQSGPSTWIAGDYPDGYENYPVAGVSWYEAAAYAEYVGKKLPTIIHWGSAAGFQFEAFGNYFYSKLFPLSNFKGTGPLPVGTNHAITCFGTMDMAGNAREWCWNEGPDGRIVRGGGWDDVVYMYGNISQLPPFDRSPKNGFRCVKYLNSEKIQGTAFQPYVLPESRNYAIERPVSESTYRIFKNRYLYDNLPLDALIENRDTSFQDWILEKVSFNAAYNNERMIVYLFLPKNSTPPYQTLIFFPGSNALSTRDFNKNYWANWFTDFVLKSGRAVLYPVYEGTFERIDNEKSVTNEGHQYADWLTKWVKDFKRSVDYLFTRSDIDTGKLAYYGHSWGARLGAIIPAVEERLKASVLIVGGLPTSKRIPEADEINYLPYIKIPVLMVNGKYDLAFPYETTVKPFYDLLGTQPANKHLKIYDTDHYIRKDEMIKDVLEFLDEYLGTVK
jgi:eukaryotic-like serine/threonine-protein kinase